MKTSDRAKHDYDDVILVLQGGGALGAYQAGVFEGMAETGYKPSWVTGVVIGSLNSALIAGNPAQRRVERLRDFWELVYSGLLASAPTFSGPLHRAFNRVSAAISATLGVPGKTRFNTTHVADLQRLRSALRRLLEKVPPELKADPDLTTLDAICCSPHIDIVHLINRRYSYTSASKDETRGPTARANATGLRSYM